MQHSMVRGGGDEGVGEKLKKGKRGKETRSKEEEGRGKFFIFIMYKTHS